MNDSPETDGFQPTGVSTTDWEQIAAVEVLAYEYAITAALGRRVGKGARLLVTNGHPHDEAEPETQRLIGSLDRRNLKYGTPGGREGALASDLSTRAPGWGDEVVAFIPNLAREKAAGQRIAGVRLPDIPAYVPKTIPLSGVRELTNRFRDVFAAVYGVDPEIAIGTLWALSRRMNTDIQTIPEFAIAAYRTGYVVYAPDGVPDLEGDVASLFAAGWSTSRRSISPRRSRWIARERDSLR